MLGDSANTEAGGFLGEMFHVDCRLQSWFGSVFLLTLGYLDEKIIQILYATSVLMTYSYIESIFMSSSYRWDCILFSAAISLNF